MINTRDLGHKELYYTVANNLSVGTGLTALVIQLRGPATVESFRKSILFLMDRHPSMRTALQGNIQEGFRFVIQKTTSVASEAERQIRIVERKNDEHWKNVVEDEFKIGIQNNSKILWRFTLIRSANEQSQHELLMLFHHSITDGRSMMLLCEELLGYWAEFDTQETPKKKGLPPLPAMDTFFSTLTGFDVKTPRPSQWSNNLISYPFEVYTLLERRQMKFHYTSMDSNKVIRLRRRCRRENTTVNSIFCAVLLRQLNRHFFEMQGLRKARQSVAVETAVSLRPYLKSSVQLPATGFFNISIETHHILSDYSSIWDLARVYGKQLRQQLHHKYHTDMVHTKPNALKIREDILQSADFCEKNKCFHKGLFISNLGSINMPLQYGTRRIIRSYKLSNQLDGGYGLWPTIHSIQNEMSITWCCPGGLWRDNSIVSIATQTLNLLEELCEEEKSGFGA